MHAAWGPFYQHGLTLIQALISNYIQYNVWDEITYPFLNFNRATARYSAFYNLSTLGFKLFYVSKMGPQLYQINIFNRIWRRAE